MLISEKEPVLTLRAASRAFFDKSAEGRDPRAGPHHDDRGAVIFRKPEIIVVMEEDVDLIADRQIVGDVARGDPVAIAIVSVVANRSHGKMDLVFVLFQA